MDLRNYLRWLRRHWVLIVAGTLIGILAGAAVSALARPTYTAETQLFVSIQGSGSIAELREAEAFSQARVDTYVKLAASPMVLQPAIDSLGLSEGPEKLAGRVTASADANTVLIDIHVVDDSPTQAAKVAQAVANSLIRVVDNLEKSKTGGASPIGLSVTKPAIAPTTPSSPNTRINLILGLVIGLGLGLVVAHLRSTWEDAVGGEAELHRATDALLLGRIPLDKRAIKRPLLTQSAAQTPRAESFRELRTNLHFGKTSGRSKSVLITSSLPGEGRSTIAINLAIAVAAAGQSVCLVDADLRRPMVADYLGLTRKEGLTTVLSGDGSVGDVLQPWGDKSLFILAAGGIPPNPSELVDSEQMKSLLKHLEARFDAVILDAPPLIPFTDAAVLSQHVGGTLLVVAEQEVRVQDVERSLKALGMVTSNLLGVVLNRTTGRAPDHSRGYVRRVATIMDADVAERRPAKSGIGA